jgi:hypothetical protein
MLMAISAELDGAIKKYANGICKPQYKTDQEANDLCKDPDPDVIHCRDFVESAILHASSY